MGSFPELVDDHLGFLQVFSDGSVFRRPENELPFPMKIQDDGSAIWKDCLFDEKHGLHLRLYKPTLISTRTRTIGDYTSRDKVSDSHPSGKLPILFFFHGGGFIFGSRTWPNFHNTCLCLSASLQALVVAPDYRLAPEHRLPAALQDVVSAFKWVQAQALAETPEEAWLAEDWVDFNRVFVVGDSSGGNLAHHLAVKLGGGSPEVAAPVRVRGYVLLAPFFGGTVRTRSELEACEPFLKLEFLDRFWRLSLLVGVNSDHPLANPFGTKSPCLQTTRLQPMLIIVGGNEIMKDRVEGYARKLKQMDKTIDCVVFPEEHHGFFTDNPFSESGEKTLQEIKHFMYKAYN